MDLWATHRSSAQVAPGSRGESIRPASSIRRSSEAPAPLPQWVRPRGHVAPKSAPTTPRQAGPASASASRQLALTSSRTPQAQAQQASDARSTTSTGLSSGPHGGFSLRTSASSSLNLPPPHQLHQAAVGRALSAGRSTSVPRTGTAPRSQSVDSGSLMRTRRLVECRKREEAMRMASLSFGEADTKVGWVCVGGSNCPLTAGTKAFGLQASKSCSEIDAG
jgi:hypothetical protein